MADTPKNDIEKRLRDYARLRRDAAGSPELHPATRALLQAEVKQQLGSAIATPTSRNIWLRFWPRFAFALGVIVLLGITAILFVPTGQKPKDSFALAKLEEAKPAMVLSDKSEATPVLAPVPAAAPAMREAAAASAPPTSENLKSRTDTPARTEPAKSLKGGAGREFAKTAAPSSPVGASVNATPSAGQGFFIASQDRAKESTITASGSIAPAKPASSPIQTDALVATAAANKDLKTTTRSAGKKAEGGELLFNAASASQNTFNTKLGANGQRYRNIVVAENQKQAVPPVLDEFTVAQDGETLTVIDRDGSVYNGYARITPTKQQSYDVESANPVQLVPNSGTGGRAGATLEQRANQLNQASQNLLAGQAAQVQNAVMPLNFVFRVEGTNLSLNERVVFTGNLLQNPGNYYNNAGAAQNTASARNYQQQVAPTGNALINNAAQNAPAFNNVINGRVQLGNQKPGELNALSVGQ